MTRFGVLFALFAFLALALTFGIQDYSLWNDEGYSVLLARHTYAELSQAIHTYYFAPPLWYWLCRIFLNVFREPWAVRVPSLLATWGSAALIFLLLRRRFALETAALGVVFYLASPYTLLYAQEGRV